MVMLLRKHPAISFIAVLVIALLVWGFWPQPVQVETVAAWRAPMTVSLEGEGRTRVIDRFVIAAPVDGVACRQQLKVGDAVEQGQELLGITPLQSEVLDPRSRARAEAGVAAATSALRAAEEQAQAAAAQAALAAAELERLRPLMERALISRDSFDKASAQARTSAASRRSADFSVDVARFELEAARTLLQRSGGGATAAERLPILAPISGEVLKVTRECEGPVRTGEVLLEIGDTSALEIEVDVLSADAVRIKPGMKVLFERWGGEQPLEGVVRRIEPVGFTKTSALGVEEQRVLVISDFVSPREQWQRLGDGYRVEARFVLWQQDDVLQVPAGALFRDGAGWAVFVAEDGRARRRVVELGQRTGLSAQILAGLEAGEQIIDHPDDEVGDGSSVEVRLSR